MDNTGTRFDFTVTADNAEVLEWEFSRLSGEVFDVSGATFDAVVTDADGQLVAAAVLVQHGAVAGSLSVSVAALPAAVYAYEVWSLSAEGVRARVIYGCLTAVSSAAALLMVAEASGRPFRVLRVLVPDEVGSPLLLAWRASSVSSAAAVEAGRQAESARLSAEAAAAAALRAESSAQEAAASVDGASADAERLLEEGQRRMEETLGRVSESVVAMNAVLAVWDGKIQSVLILNPQTETIWIAGKDTGCRYRGEDGRCPQISERGTWLLWQNGQWVDSGRSVRGDDGFSPYINAAGNWVTWNPLAGELQDSGFCALGRDGRDGATVRRLVFDSVDDLPTVPELCHGGVYCYVPLPDAPSVALLTVREQGRSAGDVLRVDGIEVELPAPDLAPDVAAAVLAEALVGAGFVASASGAVVELVGDCDHAFGFEGLNEVGYGLELHVGMRREHEYAVYGWLVFPDGEARWALVGEAQDLASAEVAGLVRFASDAICVSGGAPVVPNARGQMVVPPADFSMRGSVLPSVQETLASGSGIGFDLSGRLRGMLASAGVAGAVRFSLPDGVAGCSCVGLMADGSAGCAWASLLSGGAVRLGSELDQLNRIPYQLGVGATPDHCLSNNLLFGGALQHRKRAGWLAFDMPWVDEDSGFLSENSYYLGLATSDSFVQSESVGLELRDATAVEGVLGGVRVSHSVTGAADVVPSGRAWMNFVYDYTYSRAEARSYFESQVHAEATFETKVHVEELRVLAASTYETMEAADEMERTLRELVRSGDAGLRGLIEVLRSGKVDKTSSWEGDVVLTQDEYNALSVHNPKIKYFIVEP